MFCRCLPSGFALARITDTGLACVFTLDTMPRDLPYNHCFCDRKTANARAANRGSPIPLVGTDMIRLEAQVSVQCDGRTEVCRLGVQKSRGGVHVRASGMIREIIQDWSAERGWREYVLSWYVHVCF